MNIIVSWIIFSDCSLILFIGFVSWTLLSSLTNTSENGWQIPCDFLHAVRHSAGPVFLPPLLSWCSNVSPWIPHSSLVSCLYTGKGVSEGSWGNTMNRWRGRGKWPFFKSRVVILMLRSDQSHAELFDSWSGHHVRMGPDLLSHQPPGVACYPLPGESQALSVSP